MSDKGLWRGRSQAQHKALCVHRSALSRPNPSSNPLIPLPQASVCLSSTQKTSQNHAAICA